MGSPDFVNAAVVDFDYAQDTGVTDVNTIIASVRTRLVTNLGWTEPTTALFQSPAIPGSTKFMDILLTRITATNLEIRVRDFRAQTLITRRIQIDGAGTSVNYFATSLGIWIESLRATAEIGGGTLLELSPMAMTVLDNIIVANAFRTSGDTNDSGFITTFQLFAFDNASATNANRVFPNNQNNTPANVNFTTGALTPLYKDILVRINQAGANVITGRLPQAYLIDSNIAFGTDKTVPYDDSNNATWRCIGLATGTNAVRAALRKA